jgi:tetratricopeptide (TPR) repeat protein
MPIPCEPQLFSKFRVNDTWYSSCIDHKIESVKLGDRAWHHDEAEAQRAQELDPLSPEIVSQLGNVYFYMRRYDESIAQYQKALDLYPTAGIRAFLGLTYARKRMYPQAIAEFDKIADQDKATAAENQFVLGFLGWVYAVSGRRTDALKIARQLKELSLHGYVDLYQLAVIYAGLGDKDETFRLLEKAYEQRAASIPYLAVDPALDDIRSDSRYADLLRRVGLPQLK